MSRTSKLSSDVPPPSPPKVLDLCVRRQRFPLRRLRASRPIQCPIWKGSAVLTSRSQSRALSTLKKILSRLLFQSSANESLMQRLLVVASFMTMAYIAVLLLMHLCRSSADEGSPRRVKVHSHPRPPTHTMTRPPSLATGHTQSLVARKALAFPITAPSLIQPCEIFRAATMPPTFTPMTTTLGDIARKLKLRDVSSIDGVLLARTARTILKPDRCTTMTTTEPATVAADTITEAMTRVATSPICPAITTLRLSLLRIVKEYPHCLDPANQFRVVFRSIVLCAWASGFAYPLEFLLIVSELHRYCDLQPRANMLVLVAAGVQVTINGAARSCRVSTNKKMIWHHNLCKSLLVSLLLDGCGVAYDQSIIVCERLSE